MTFITNDCLAYFMYQKLKTEYESPLIGSLFVSDEQYVKFCNRAYYYLGVTPRFDKPLHARRVMGKEEYPVMYLEDIEIHWPHEHDGEASLMEKYNRRKDRVHDPLFYWSDDQMLQGYNRKLHNEFIGQFYFAKYIPNYKPRSLDYNKLAEFITGAPPSDIHYHSSHG